MPDRTRRNPTRIIRRAIPYLIERVADPAIPDARLTPLERTVRAWRLEVLADLGGDAASAARRALLDATVGTKLILSSLDAYLFHLATAEDQGMVNRRGRFAFRIVHHRMRVADSFTRQLQALGLDRAERAPVALQEYLARRSSGSAPDAAPADGAPPVDDDVRETGPDGPAGPNASGQSACAGDRTCCRIGRPASLLHRATFKPRRLDTRRPKRSAR